VSQPATLAWFARHELRLSWRDTISMLTTGKRRREPILCVVAAAFLLLMHLLAYAVIAPFSQDSITPDKATLVAITGAAFLSWALMLSQAIETVTRTFYARGDLDLILSSPASTRRLFAVRMTAIALSSMLLATFLSGPFLNVLVFVEGPKWLAGYGVLCAMAMFSTASAILVTVLLLRVLGPKLTRLISQIVSAVVAAAFVIGVQIAAILSTGSFSRLSILRSESIVEAAPGISSAMWWPALAIMGDMAALVTVIFISSGLLALVVATCSATSADHVTEISGAADRVMKASRPSRKFRSGSIKWTLRRKELLLLRRDPWLLSQTLMQILYLLPPVLLLWLNFGSNASVLLVLVPVLVMASGQLAGGLAWLTVSGEDAPDLVESAPVSERSAFSAKIETVLGTVFVIVTPLLFGLAMAAPKLALFSALGIIVSASSGTMIQYMLRAQSRRVGLRRRQIPSRVATLAEALSSILWAGAATLAALGSGFAWIIALAALLVLAAVWAIKPQK
jgi:ABC-2 type transport system permease protein